MEENDRRYRAATTDLSGPLARRSRLIEFTCECAFPDTCPEIVLLALDEYETIRDRSDERIVAVAHAPSALAGARTIRRSRYVVVEDPAIRSRSRAA